MKNKKKRVPIFLMGIGIMMILSALGIVGYNQFENKSADIKAREIVSEMNKMMKQSEGGINEGSLIIDGKQYIGIIDIPSLEIKLPVHESWSYEYLKSAPCLYNGKPGEKGFVIAAHNYSSHFGKIKSLNIGDTIEFTSASGFTYSYEIAKLETVEPYDIEHMIKNEWDLTLFTCTLDGQHRVTVRCVSK